MLLFLLTVFRWALKYHSMSFLLLLLFWDSTSPVWRDDEVMTYCKQSCSQAFSTFLEAGNLQRVCYESCKPSNLKIILYPKIQYCEFSFSFHNSFLYTDKYSLKSLKLGSHPIRMQRMHLSVLVQNWKAEISCLVCSTDSLNHISGWRQHESTLDWQNCPTVREEAAWEAEMLFSGISCLSTHMSLLWLQNSQFWPESFLD